MNMYSFIKCGFNKSLDLCNGSVFVHISKHASEGVCNLLPYLLKLNEVIVPKKQMYFFQNAEKMGEKNRKKNPTIMRRNDKVRWTHDDN